MHLVAILAFKGVVAMNMTRIANNKKVVVLQATMQETMMVLFQYAVLVSFLLGN